MTSRPVITINKTCTLTSRSRLESYKRLVSVSSRLVKPTSWSRLGLGRWAPRSRFGLSSFYVSCPSLRHPKPTCSTNSFHHKCQMSSTSYTDIRTDLIPYSASFRFLLSLNNKYMALMQGRIYS